MLTVRTKNNSNLNLLSIRNSAASTNSCLHLTRVRVSGGHLCAAEAPTEAAAETVGFAHWAKPGGREKLTKTTTYRLLSIYRYLGLKSKI